MPRTSTQSHAALSSPPSSTGEDPVPPDLLAVIALFSGELATIPFPDVDGALLGKQADELRAAAGLVDSARAALDAAQAALAARTDLLARTAARGLAYARIYAEAHPDRQALVAAVAGLAAPGAVDAQAVVAQKRRGRPPRAKGEPLFDDAERAPVAEEAQI
jgi:hypothetical protein